MEGKKNGNSRIRNDLVRDNQNGIGCDVPKMQRGKVHKGLPYMHESLLSVAGKENKSRHIMVCKHTCCAYEHVAYNLSILGKKEVFYGQK